MKLHLPILFLGGLLLVAGTAAGQAKRVNRATSPAGQPTPRKGVVPAAGFVPDSATAVKIAEAVWLPIFGPGIVGNRPFRARLHNGAVWMVSGSMSMPDSIPYDDRPYIEIRKKDGQIVFVRRGKM